MSDLIDRVILSLDAASESRRPIETASHLAARWKARLHGVFVEDEDLLNLARLPFARQAALGGAAEPLTLDYAERQLRAMGERARADVAAAATRANLDWSFRVMRGAPLGAALGNSEHDLTVTGALTRAIGGHFRARGDRRRAAAGAAGPVLFAQSAWERGGPFLTLLRDRSAHSVRLLRLAGEIAQARSGELTILCPPEIATAPGFEAWVADCLAPNAPQSHIERLAGDGAAVERAMAKLGCQLLAADAATADATPDRWHQLSEHAACDLLLLH